MRILDETKGTGAVTRVLLDASDGEESWGSIGVSENIIEASWEALVDSIEFGMLRGSQGPEPPDGIRKETAMSDADKVLEVMAAAGEPLNAGAIAERSGHGPPGRGQGDGRAEEGRPHRVAQALLLGAQRLTAARLTG